MNVEERSRPVPAGISTLKFDVQKETQGLLRVIPSGRMEAMNIGPLWKQLGKIFKKKDAANVILDLDKVDYIDMSGQALILHYTRLAKEKGLRFQLTGLRPDFKHVHDQVSCFDCKPGPGFLKRSSIEELGHAAVNLVRDTRDFFSFVGEFVTTSVQALLRPGNVRWKDVLLHVENVGGKAVFIIALMGFLVGLIISFQSALILRMFGAEIFIAQLLGLTMVRELGPLVTAIILAGRSGSAFAAEIGTMKTNEEINALQTMGLNPIRFLVLPKMLATMLVTPFLCMFFLFFSFIGGALVMLSLDFTLTAYLNHLRISIGMIDFLGGMFKVLVFSLLVAWIGCVRGLQTGFGARAVGRSTTSAVVSAIVLIILADGIFAVVYYVLGI